MPPEWIEYICYCFFGYIWICIVVAWLVYAYTPLFEQEENDAENGTD